MKGVVLSISTILWMVNLPEMGDINESIMNFRFFSRCIYGLVSLLSVMAIMPLQANVPGGGTGTGPNVTLTDNGSTVVLNNGTVSLLCTKSGASINQINYTFNNSGTPRTLNLLSGGNNGGQLYWENSSDEGLAFTYTKVADPASNNGDYAEISMITTSVSNDWLEVHYSLPRGASGFYVTAIYGHSGTNGAFGMGECRDNIYAGSMFNWMHVDNARNRIMEVSGGSAIAVQGAPKEVSLWTNGIYAGDYEDKYKYSADLGINHLWGWGSVGAGGNNVGLWNITASSEYYNGGPLKRELMEHIGTTVLNMLNGGHYGMGSDGNFASGEVWTKVCGPYFIYCNAITNTITSTNLAAQALYADAQAQDQAEQSAWPYSWFTNSNFTPGSGRGAVAGSIAISDPYNPNASASNLWVGLIQQPATSAGIYDFQQWMKPYQFWAQTDATGHFTIPNVLAGTNYTLYAFGPGAAGTFMSQSQNGNAPPLLVDIPSSPFSVTVSPETTNNLGTVTWTPNRVGPTVFEIGFPDRTASKFRHGDDFWVGDIGPSPTAPSPIWSKWLEFPFDFPNGLNYVVGQSRWTTDWNFVQPVVRDGLGNYDDSSSTITFSLPTPPASGALASFYLGLASDYYAALIITVNGVNLGSAGGVSGSPQTSVPTSGYYAGYGDSDTSIREGNNAAFSDERLTFPASLLHAGNNTINISIRQVGGSYFADHAMYDYIRLELSGYVPGAPSSVAAYPGNNAALVSWPVCPGATSYTVLRSASVNGSYSTVAQGVVGPVCGSGWNNATWLDTSALNGSTYYYKVQANNVVGSSATSPASGSATPSGALPTSPPPTPTGLQVLSSGHQFASLQWLPSANASFYSIWRSTLVSSGGGSSNVLSTIILDNATTNNYFTDSTLTDGSIYQYTVTANGPGGVSGASAPVFVIPRPATPGSLPISLTGVFTQTNVISLNWSPVQGAVGYALYQATSPQGPFTYIQTITMTNYSLGGINPASVYYYKVVAVNAGGTSGAATDWVNSTQPPPSSLQATASGQQITLNWSAPTNTSSYTIYRGLSPGNETNTVATGVTGLSYVDSTLLGGLTYYYVVTANGPGGASGHSPEASATTQGNSTFIWTSTSGGAWDVSTNWAGNSVAAGFGNLADFSQLSLSTNVSVSLDSPTVIGNLDFGDFSQAFSWTLGGAGPLTLAPAPVINVVNDSATITVPLDGSGGLTKSGVGTLVLGGATNQINGGMNIYSGTLSLDYSLSNSPATNLLPNSNPLSMGGGTLQVTGNGQASITQGFSGLSLIAGASVLSAQPASPNYLPTVQVGGVTPNPGAVIDFNGPATIGAGGANIPASAIMTTSNSGSAAFVGTGSSPFLDSFYATAGLYDFAACTGSKSPYSIVGGSQIAGFYTQASGNTAVTSGNLDVIGNISGWSAQPYLTSLRCNASLGSAQSISASGKGSTLTLADVLITPEVGPYNVSFNSGAIRPGSDSYNPVPFVVWQNNTAGELVMNTAINNSKAGSSSYVQAGSGTVILSASANGFSGPSYLNGGATLVGSNSALGNPASNAPVNLDGGSLVASSSFSLDNGSGLNRSIYLLGSGGGLAALPGQLLNVDGAVSGANLSGPLVIGLAASAANSEVPGLLPGTGPSTANPSPALATGTVLMTNANSYPGGTLIESGTLMINGLGSLGGSQFGGLVLNGGTLAFAPASGVVNGATDLTLGGGQGITLAQAGGTLDLNGQAIVFSKAFGNHGPGAFRILSSSPGGSLTLSGNNQYSGDTVVSNSTLVLDNTSGSATGQGNITAQSGATLTGSGSVAGSGFLLSGSFLIPSSLSSIFQLSGDLTCSSGSEIICPVSPPASSSLVKVGGLFSMGGVLVVTNAGGSFANGDSFALFQSGTFAGSFQSVILPSLSSNLVWNTNLLASQGILSVTTLSAPIFSATYMAGNNLVFQAAGGPPNYPFTLLSTTNLASGIWTPVTTNVLDSSGHVSMTNSINAGQPQTFFRLKLN